MTEDWARPVVAWELQARDVEKQREFYASLFNWQIEAGPAMRIPAGIGGPDPGPSGILRPGDRSGVTLYIQVRDLSASVIRAAELGGTILRKGEVVPGEVTTATILDPEGNRVVLVQQ